MSSHLCFLFLWFIFVHSALSLEEGYFKNDEENTSNTSNSTSAINFYCEKPLKITERQSHLINWTSSVEGVQGVIVTLKDEFVAVISSHNETFHPSDASALEYSFENGTVTDAVTVEGTINVTAAFIGFNKLFVALLDKNNTIVANESLQVNVLLHSKEIVYVYQICLTVLLVIVYVNMGANLDLKLVKGIIKQPIGPFIGLVCQYLCMPLIAFALGLLIFPNEPLFRLGLFTSGSSPGGGLSNIWTHLLGGSLDLSIMMTFTSTVVSLGAVPFWLLTVGKIILAGGDFVIPYTKVLTGIMILILPCFVGIAIQLKLPRVTRVMKILLTPISILNILFIFTFGLYTNFYLFSYMSWKAIGAGFGLSISGLIVGFAIAFLCRRSLKEMIAISIETAVQNNQIAFILLKMSLDKPAGDLAILLPGCVALFMPMPLLLALIGKVTYQKLIRPQWDSKSNKGAEKTIEKELEIEFTREKWNKDSEGGITVMEREEEGKVDSNEREDEEIRIIQDAITEKGIDNPAMELEKKEKS